MPSQGKRPSCAQSTKAKRALGKRGFAEARSELLAAIREDAAEVGPGLTLDGLGAEGLLTESLTLVHRLPATLAALEAGVLHRGHLWHLLDKVAPIEDAVIRAGSRGALVIDGGVTVKGP